MAKTPGDAINQLKKSPRFRELNDSSFAAQAADDALEIMWGAYQWRQSLVEFPPFYMTPNESDHKAPDIQIPTDFFALKEAWIRQIQGEIFELDVLNNLPVSSYPSKPLSISWQSEFSGFRLHPRPSDGWGAPLCQVEGIYKKQAPTITDDTINTFSLPFEDEYFQVYKEFLKYKYLEILDSPDAGQVQFVNGIAQYTGQLGKSKAALREAIMQENIYEGDEFVAPENDLELW